MTLHIDDKLAGIDRKNGHDIRRVLHDGAYWFVAVDLVAATLPNDELVAQVAAYDPPIQWRSLKLVPRAALAEIGATNEKAAELCDYLEAQVQQAIVNAANPYRRSA